MLSLILLSSFYTSGQRIHLLQVGGLRSQREFPVSFFFGFLATYLTSSLPFVVYSDDDQMVVSIASISQQV